MTPTAGINATFSGRSSTTTGVEASVTHKRGTKVSGQRGLYKVATELQVLPLGGSQKTMQFTTYLEIPDDERQGA